MYRCTLHRLDGFLHVPLLSLADGLIHFLESLLVVFGPFMFSIYGFLEIGIRMFLVGFDQLFFPFFRMTAYSFDIAFLSATDRFLQMFERFFFVILLFGMQRGRISEDKQSQ